MTISIIVAMSASRVIGYRNQLPWQLPADLAYFRRTTLGKPIIMGRKTFESIGKPLPGRDNYIITRDSSYTVQGGRVFQHIADALDEASSNAAEVMVIGGGQIYQAILPQASRLYVTLVKGDFQGDVYFPAYNISNWSVVSTTAHQADNKHTNDYEFKVLQRRRAIV